MWLSNVSLPHFFLNECCLIGGVLDLTPWGCLKSIKRSFWPKVCSWCRPGGRYSNLLVKTLRFAQGEQSFGTAPNILRVPPRRSHSGASHLRGLKFKLRSWTYITRKGIGWAMSWSPWRLGNKIKRLCYKQSLFHFQVPLRWFELNKLISSVFIRTQNSILKYRPGATHGYESVDFVTNNRWVMPKLIIMRLNSVFFYL